jgi:Flp pilus assembly protein TadB
MPQVGAALVGGATGVALLAASRIVRWRDRRRPLDALGVVPVDGHVRSLVGAAMAGVGGLGPLVRRRRRRDAAATSVLLADFVDALVRSARGGAALPDAAREAAEVVGEPLVAAIARVDRDVAFGESWVAAMDAWADRSGDPDVRLVAVACGLGVEMGRGTADALSGVASTLATAATRPARRGPRPPRRRPRLRC